MAAYASEDQVRQDEEFARRLQQEDMGASFMVPRSSSQLDLGNRPVQNNLAEEFIQVNADSPRIIAFYCFLWFAETMTTIVILSLEWNSECDEPLKLWLMAFTMRLIVTIPLRIKQFLDFNNERPPNMDVRRAETLARLLFVVWFIIGQNWLYSSDTCRDTAPHLYNYTLALVVMAYISILLPIIILLALCFCLPCLLVLLRIIGDGRGADENIIQKLPTRKYTQTRNGGPDDAEAEPASCAICMYDYTENDELRILPCEHEFHLECVDKWLKIKKECPLCRRDITQSDLEEQCE